MQFQVLSEKSIYFKIMKNMCCFLEILLIFICYF